MDRAVSDSKSGGKRGSGSKVVGSTQTQPPGNGKKRRLEPVLLEALPNVGMLGLDKGEWACGGGLGS